MPSFVITSVSEREAEEVVLRIHLQALKGKDREAVWNAEALYYAGIGPEPECDHTIKADDCEASVV